MSLVAYGVPIAILQLVVFPLMASELTPEEYGLAISLIALLNLVPAALGNMLNNLRLMQQTPEDDESYRLVLLILLGIDAVAIICLTLFYSPRFDVTLIVMVITATLMLMQEYFKVSYRIDLDFKSIAVNAVVLTVGYLLGYLFFLGVEEWSLVYLSGQVFGLTYVFATTSLWRGPIGKTAGFTKLCKDSLILSVSIILARLITYADRLVLYPLIGGYYVSIYYVSTLLGKLVSAIVSPMNSVMLSYLSKMEKQPGKLFVLATVGCVGICLIAYIVTLLVSDPVLRVLYPQYVDEALVYIAVTTAAAYMNVLITVMNPFVLKFTPLKNQIFINAGFLLVYVGFALLGLSSGGLMGFCVGALFAIVLKAIIMVGVYVFNYRRQH